MRLNTFLHCGLAVSLSFAFGVASAQTPPVSKPAYDGLKKTVSVDVFQAAELFGGKVTADGLTAMLTTALIKDGRFVVVERPGIASVQAEQALGQMGSANPETAAKVGQIIGSSAIVRGVVTKYEAAAKGNSLNVGGPMSGLLGGNAGLKNQTAVMEISLRLIDTTTSQVISTSSAQGSANSSSVDASLTNARTGATAGVGSFQNALIGHAADQAIIKAVEQIAAGMRNVPWTALVIDNPDGTIYVNAGADRNMQVGMFLEVYRKGRVLTDPSTGVVLDVEMAKIGTLRIVSVREKLSTGELLAGQAPMRGDILKLN
jgi:curli biogenesis system outer membrane secretion channel CsgG